MHFEDFVRTKTGHEAYFKISEANRMKMIHEFDTLVKRSYQGGDLTTSVGLKGLQDNPSEGIINERINIPGYVR